MKYDCIRYRGRSATCWQSTRVSDGGGVEIRRKLIFAERIRIIANPTCEKFSCCRRVCRIGPCRRIALVRWDLRRRLYSLRKYWAWIVIRNRPIFQAVLTKFIFRQFRPKTLILITIKNMWSNKRRRGFDKKLWHIYRGGFSLGLFMQWIRN